MTWALNSGSTIFPTQKIGTKSESTVSASHVMSRSERTHFFFVLSLHAFERWEKTDRTSNPTPVVLSRQRCENGGIRIAQGRPIQASMLLPLFPQLRFTTDFVLPPGSSRHGWVPPSSRVEKEVSPIAKTSPNPLLPTGLIASAKLTSASVQLGATFSSNSPSHFLRAMLPDPLCQMTLLCFLVEPLSRYLFCFLWFNLPFSGFTWILIFPDMAIDYGSLYPHASWLNL